MNRRRGHDPVHTFRAPAELVAAARVVAGSREESLSDVIRNALVRYVEGNRPVPVDELAALLGFCLTCCDAGKVGARLDDCAHSE